MQKIAQKKKFHRQFGHVSIKNMQELIGNAKLLTKSVMGDINNLVILLE